MPSLDQVTQFCYENLEQVTTTKHGMNFHARCPFCGDSKKSQSKKRFHLKFENEKSVYGNCFNCGSSCNFYSLYAHINGVTEKEAFEKFNKYDKKSILERLKTKKVINIVKTKKEPKDFSYILNDCISLDKETDSYILKKYQELLKDFIDKRQTDQKLYIAYKGTFKGRIIIPIWNNGKMVYFQGRRAFPGMEPKYLNPEADKSNIIFNVENFNKDKYIVLTEGLLDADSVGTQGTTILGKEVSDEMIKELSNHTNVGIIIAMDNDADGNKKTNTLIKTHRELKYFIMPKKYKKIKDLNSLKTNINIESIYDFVVKNSHTYEKAKVLLRLGG